MRKKKGIKHVGPFPPDQARAIGERIRELRGARRQRDVYDAIGIPQEQQSKLERGRFSQSAALAGILDYYGVTLEWLVAGKEPRFATDKSSRKEEARVPAPSDVVDMLEKLAPRKRQALFIIASAVADGSLRESDVELLSVFAARLVQRGR